MAVRFIALLLGIAFLFGHVAVAATGPAEVLAVNPGSPHSTAFSVTQSFSIPLQPGWNLISLPGEPVDVSINAVFALPDFQEVVTTAKTQGLSITPPDCGQGSLGTNCLSAVRNGGVFTGNLTTFRKDRAYWVRTTSFAPLIVEIAAQGFTTTPLATAVLAPWDLIPVRSTDPTVSAGELVPADSYFASTGWTRAYRFNSLTAVYEALLPGTGANVEIGKGYYLAVPGDTKIVVSTFTVNSTNDVDDGNCDTTHCSLREAINAANVATSSDAIAFNITTTDPG